MGTIRVVTGTGHGPTELAAYDAALAEAGIENYNLVTVSSVIPDGATVEVVDTAGDLGPIGHRLTVVESRGVTADPGSVSAALGWRRLEGTGPGIIYEAAGDATPADLEQRVTRGLEAGFETRGWSGGDSSVVVETATSDGDRFTAAVVLACYGQAAPVFEDRAERF